MQTDVKTKIIALTGRSGSGKTMAGKYLLSIGEAVVDCDEIAKNILTQSKQCKSMAAKAFGKDIILPNGSVDRKLLASRAFANKNSQQLLTDITHPFIIKNILSCVETYSKQGFKYVYVDGAVIVDAEFEKYCDDIVVVVSDEENQLSRLEKRDNISRSALVQRLASQVSVKRLQQAASYVIVNDADIKSLYEKTALINNIIKGKYGEK